MRDWELGIEELDDLEGLTWCFDIGILYLKKGIPLRENENEQSHSKISDNYSPPD